MNASVYSQKINKGCDNMIYTVTLNPSVDYIVKVDDFTLGGLNRTTYDVKFPGGKGINVSRVLKRYGTNSQALGFIGGFTGDFVEQFLINEEIETNFIKVEDDTRINIKLNNGIETEINGMGPNISNEKLAHFLSQFNEMKKGDIVVLAGNTGALPTSIYIEIIKRCKENDILVVADVSGEALRKVVKEKPFFIKPNHHELGELFHTVIQNVDEAYKYARKLLEAGVKNMIVSLAGDGALFLNKEVAYYTKVPKGIVKNSVGAGDSVVAGFLSAYINGKSYEEAFKLGVASGSATAFSIELCLKEEALELFDEIEIENL